MLKAFDESQVYRIDHYLGKDTVQNLLVLRFGNGIFEPLWNRNYVDHVQITAAETLGVEQRAAFYETAGATRDMIQSHVLQLTSLVAMEPPAAFDATAVRNEKIKVLQSIRPFTAGEHQDATSCAGNTAREAMPGDSSLLAGYRKEPGVAKDSTTETFVAAKLQIDNWRWAGVPFYLRTGKRLPSRVTEIAIQFRRAPHLVFRGQDLVHEHPGAERPARRRNFDFLPCQAAGPGNEIENGDHGFQLSDGIWRGRAQRVCHADQRLHARRRDAV